MTSDMTLTGPALHLNGSGFDNLFEQYANATGSIRKAIQDLPAPHGRDYYVQEDGVFEKARREHEARVQKLREVLGEVEGILEGLADQRDAAKRSAI